MEIQQIKKAVIYCRVSTKEQVEEGNSLVTQEKNCREYAMKNGYEIVAIFIEQGESAKTVDRTELKKLMSFCAVKKNGINVVIAYKIDRISRNTDDYSQIRILLKRYGVEIKSTSEHFEDSPAGRFMENIIANVAQFDNDVRAERSVGGMRDAVREGRYVWMAPLGYSNVRISGKATIAPNRTTHLIKRVFELIALNTLSVDEIRKQMIVEGLRNRSGEPIAKSPFYRLIRNELYTGWICKFGERHKGLFEPIISEELFNQVQKTLKNPIVHKRYAIENSDFPLRRFITYPTGQMLTGCWSKGRNGRYPYYLFLKRKIIIRKETLENSFKNWLNYFRMDDVEFEKLLSMVKHNLGNALQSKIAEVEKLQKKVEDLKSKQVALVEKNIQGIIGNELCREQVAKIDTEIYQINQTINSLPKASIDFSKLFDLMREIIRNPGDLWEKVAFKQKIRLQWFYFPEGITFDGSKYRTGKICNLFKLKEQILPSFSHLVHHPNSKSNINNKQIPLIYEKGIDNQEEIIWSDVMNELQYLSELQKDGTSDNSASLLESRLAA